MVNTNKKFSRKIISWFSENKRSLNFRETKDPYKIWLSEVMLQQTQVKTVLPFYDKWTKKFPTVESVSFSNLDTLLKFWEGLGYYKRCINFYNASKIIVNDFNGKIPCKKEKFLSLPGVGEYTASAVMSIAFNQPFPALDGNVKRVISRVLGIKRLTNYNIKRINNFLKSEICLLKPGDFNQGLMEIGALICKPIVPKCNKCPINEYCYAQKNGFPEQFPSKTKAKLRPNYDVVVAIIWRQNKFYIQKRGTNKMLGGLWEFPGGIVKRGEDPESVLKQKVFTNCEADLKIHKKVGSVEHAFSHFNIILTGYFCSERKYFIEEKENRKWISKKNIKDYPFPKANHKLFKKLELHN